MTELVVNLPAKPPGLEVEVFPYGLFPNRTRHQIPNVYQTVDIVVDGEITGSEEVLVRKIFAGEDFDGPGFVATDTSPKDLGPPPPPLEDPDPPTDPEGTE